MGLTSGLLLLTMVAAAVAWVVATALVWPRLAGQPRSRVSGWPLAARLAGRLGLLIGSQALILAAFLVWLNSYFAFYGSWSELLGTGLTTVKVARPTGRFVSTPVATPPAGRPSQLPASMLFYGFGLGPGLGHPAPAPAAGGHGTRRLIRLPGAARYGMLARIQIKGLRTGLTDNVGYVYLPPQYFWPAYAQVKFPAVLALSGYPGSARDLIDLLGLPATAARLELAHRVTPAVYVMLNVSPLFPRDTECTNVPAGPQVDSFFAIDVPLAIEQALRVSTSRTGWGTFGFSAGGHCAAKLAMLYPGTFSAAVSMAAIYTALRTSNTGDLYGGSRAYRNENNLDWRLRHLPAPPVSVLVTSSKAGEKTYQGTRKFLKLIRAPMQGYSFILPTGGHNFTVWSRELPWALEWLTFRLGHPHPARTRTLRWP